MSEKELDSDFVRLAVGSQEHTDRAFDEILPAVAHVANQMSTPETALGVVQALYRIATAIAFGTIGTPLDVLMREPEDAGALGAAHWKAASHLNSLVLAEMKRQGLKVPRELKRVVGAVPPQGDAQAAADAASLGDVNKIASTSAAIANGEEGGDNGEGDDHPGLDDIVARINTRGGGVS